MDRLIHQGKVVWDHPRIDFRTDSVCNFHLPPVPDRKLNVLVNRLSALNSKIPLEWLNGSLDSFKVKAKRLLL